MVALIRAPELAGIELTRVARLLGVPEMQSLVAEKSTSAAANSARNFELFMPLTSVAARRPIPAGL